MKPTAIAPLRCRPALVTSMAVGARYTQDTLRAVVAAAAAAEEGAGVAHGSWLSMVAYQVMKAALPAWWMEVRPIETRWAGGSFDGVAAAVLPNVAAPDTRQEALSGAAVVVWGQEIERQAARQRPASASRNGRRALMLVGQTGPPTK